MHSITITLKDKTIIDAYNSDFVPSVGDIIQAIDGNIYTVISRLLSTSPDCNIVIIVISSKEFMPTVNGRMGQ